jgi:hypothetical protein
MLLSHVIHLIPRHHSFIISGMRGRASKAPQRRMHRSSTWINFSRYVLSPSFAFPGEHTLTEMQILKKTDTEESKQYVSEIEAA